MNNSRHRKAFSGKLKIFIYDICRTRAVLTKNIFVPPFYIPLKKFRTPLFSTPVAHKMNASFTVFIRTYWKIHDKTQTTKLQEYYNNSFAFHCYFIILIGFSDFRPYDEITNISISIEHKHFSLVILSSLINTFFY